MPQQRGTQSTTKTWPLRGASTWPSTRSSEKVDISGGVSEGPKHVEKNTCFARETIGNIGKTCINLMKYWVSSCDKCWIAQGK